MSRSYRYVEPVRARDLFWNAEEIPLYRRMKWPAQSNPPSSYRRKWRKEVRVRIKQQMQQCSDFDDLNLETRTNRLTDLWDWY